MQPALLNQRLYDALLAYMHQQMADVAHDTEHVLRVLYLALDIAAHITAPPPVGGLAGDDSQGDASPDSGALPDVTDTEVPGKQLADMQPAPRMEILVPACLLHDVGRSAQFADPAVDHALAGSNMAYRFMLQQGYSLADAEAVRQAVRTHRYRAQNPPQSLEAKILFDADKLDATGLMGIARSLIYCGQVGRPLYTTGPDGNVLPGDDDDPPSGDTPSLLHEYCFKLRHLYGRFYTRRGAALAAARQPVAQAAYQALLQEAQAGRNAGKALLQQLLAGQG